MSTIADAVIVIRIEGLIDLSSVGMLHMDLANAVRRAPGASVFVDLDGVRSIDDAGLGILLGAAAAARDGGGDLTLVCADDALRARLARTRVDRAVDVRHRIADA